MNIRKIIREIVEEFLDEKYPEEFSFKELEDIRSYSGKLKYAEKHLQKLASGSARVVYKVDDNKVLKIAKNKKGLAQNQVEAQGYLQQYEIVAQIFDTDDNDYWIEMEFARRLSKPEFKKITGVSLDELKHYLIYHRIYSQPKKHMGFGYSIDQDIKERMENSEFVNELLSFAADNDMSTGDMGRISTWGKVIRDGKEHVVLIDYGLTNSVYEDYYMIS